MAAKKQSGLRGLTTQMRSEKKAERSPATTLHKIIDDFCLSSVMIEDKHYSAFDVYLLKHKDTLGQYISDYHEDRKGKWRASAAGKCCQQQAFDVVALTGVIAGEPERKRTAANARALMNGTFGHLRWHIIFDALHEAGSVKTIWKEERRYDPEWDMSGTCDRVIEFTFIDKLVRSVVDFKTMKARYFDKLLKPNVDNAFQQHSYQKFEYGADSWLMLYENKDSHELKIFHSEYSELMTMQLKKNYTAMTKWVTQYEMDVPIAQRIKLPLNVEWCNFCKWQRHCLVEHPNLRELQAKIGVEEDAINV